MSKEKLMPALRFPEFKNERECLVQELGKIYEIGLKWLMFHLMLNK
jgi:hypothetical protein